MESVRVYLYWDLFRRSYPRGIRGAGYVSLGSPLAIANHLADDDELAKDVRVYVLADYFFVEGLKDYALERFKSKAQQLWVSENFVDCIRDVYESTQDLEFREVVLGVAYEHLPDLWSKKPFRDLIHEGGDLAVALMGEIIKPEKAERGR